MPQNQPTRVHPASSSDMAGPAMLAKQTERHQVEEAADMLLSIGKDKQKPRQQVVQHAKSCAPRKQRQSRPQHCKRKAAAVRKTLEVNDNKRCKRPASEPETSRLAPLKASNVTFRRLVTTAKRLQQEDSGAKDVLAAAEMFKQGLMLCKRALKNQGSDSNLWQENLVQVIAALDGVLDMH